MYDGGGHACICIEGDHGNSHTDLVDTVHPLAVVRHCTRLHTTPTMSSELCPVYAPFFGAMGCTSAIVFTCTSHPSVARHHADSHPISHPPGIGAAYGTAKSGVGISAMSMLRPDLMMKCVVPVIMAGIIAIVSRSRCSDGLVARERAAGRARYAAESNRGRWERAGKGWDGTQVPMAHRQHLSPTFSRYRMDRQAVRQLNLSALDHFLSSAAPIATVAKAVHAFQ